MFESLSPYSIGFSALLLYVLRTYLQARAVWKKFRAIPGRRTLISEFSLVINFFKDMKYISPGPYKGWREKHREHSRYGWDVISSVALLPTPRGGLIVNDAHAVKTIFSSRQKFPKPTRPYKMLGFFGSNILVTDLDEWKRHRKIAAPGFGEKNNKLAFEESVREITSLFEGEWHGKQEIVLEDALELTMAVALMTISAAGFGRRIPWGDDEVPPGHKLSFKRSVEILGTGLFIRLVCPKWIFEWGPTEKIREARDGFAEFRAYLTEMIDERRVSHGKNERRDLLSNLVEANDEFLDDGEQRLTEEELLGNMFIFYLAGHETSGHTLGFALNMLAVHPEEQEALHKHIQDVFPDGRLPAYEDISKLNRVTATLYETLRMFPPVTGIPKSIAEDTPVAVANEAGETAVFQFPAGCEVTIDTAGLHHNPRYWDDPFTFKPERFLGEWDKDAFIPFSGGPRACIGRGFFETTGLAILTILIQHYKVEPHPKYASESFEQLMERYSQGSGTITLTPSCSSLVFKKRE